ncbi:MAG: carbon starvation protein A [Synergistetes bacterium]|nr:carbon starvation protein A [Synergistota bacterium]MDW8192820.1 carbon starvation protein A [Synergistota bacterium]
MSSLIVLIAAAIYLVAYFTYGKRLEKNVVKADPNRPTPAVALKDGVDYYPAHPFVLYGHHFASIAGAGPILGPAMAMAWGWLPSLMWVWLGNIFIGSIHDYLSLMASVRYEGKSIQYVAGKIMSKRTSYIFELFVYFALILVVAAFTVTLAQTFVADPSVPTASIGFIIAAVISGYIMYRTSWGMKGGTVIGLILVALSIWLGYVFPIKLSTQTWYVLTFIYIVFAAALPVWILLQPRDYLNAYILWVGLILGGISFLFLAKGFNFPAYTTFSPNIVGGKPSPFWPTVPLVIACGALSGFHSLVASGTSSKQLDSELSGLLVGYGSMFTEGFLSTIVIISVAVFGLSALEGAADKLTQMNINLNMLKAGGTYLGQNYLKSAGAVGGPLGPFYFGYAKGLESILGIPFKIGRTFAGLWVSCFVLTTLDTTNRLARFAWAEIFEPLRESSPGLYAFIANRWVGSLIAAIFGVGLAWGGALSLLWPAFAGANQLLASIALLTVAVWVTNVQKASAGYKWAAIIPAMFLWLTVTVALFWYLVAVVPAQAGIAKYTIGGMIVVMLILNFWLLYDFSKALKRGSQLFEPTT